MTELAAGYPAQRADSDETLTDIGASGSVPAVVEPASDSPPPGESRFSEAVDRVGDVAGDVADKVGNEAELAAERGTTTIADEVVEKIAGIATREVPGVYDLGGDVARIFAAVKERVGLGEAKTENKGVSVTLSGKTAEVNLTIVIEYGYVVYSVTEKVRAKVISEIENLLGLDVTTVDILVDDVHVSDEALAARSA